MRPYVVRQGDYLTEMAYRRGFSATEVWNHLSNEALRKARSNPDILQPGDVIHLPAAREDWRPLPLTAGGHNRFTARIPSVEIKLVLERADGTAIVDKPFRVDGLGPEPFESKTDSAGLARFNVPVHVRELDVFLDGEGLRYRVLVGHMDPVSEPSGVAKRLAHLGYLAPLDLKNIEPSDAMLSEALAVFQAAEGLSITGTLDDATRDALVTAHGS
ncbi:LysM domain-containing protein [Sorangium sp. So ce260]|uniref:peptidoglycan-binding protein n=1 Tax=Sorangium sp. So ce260 TaxID=3133291 RepID=UPI003F5FCA47